VGVGRRTSTLIGGGRGFDVWGCNSFVSLLGVGGVSFFDSLLLGSL